MRSEINAKTSKYCFASLPEFARWIENAPRTWREYNKGKTNPASLSWDLDAGYDKSLKLARYGWLEGAAQVQEALKAFTPMSTAPDTVTDFYGFRPHVARYCAGAPDSMIRHDDAGKNGSGRLITLLVPVAINGGTDAKYFSNFGVAVAQYINQMETEGARVEVYIGDTGQDRFHRMTYTVCIKSADQPLDLAVMAFAIGHPAMCRRLGFAFTERSALPEQPNYGAASPMTEADMIDAPNGLIILNGATQANKIARTPQDALKYISEYVEAYQTIRATPQMPREGTYQ